MPASVTTNFGYKCIAGDFCNGFFYVNSTDGIQIADLTVSLVDLSTTPAVPRTLHLGHATSRFRRHWLHGLSAEENSNCEGLTLKVRLFGFVAALLGIGVIPAQCGIIDNLASNTQISALGDNSIAYYGQSFFALPGLATNLTFQLGVSK